jgi:uncharacterized protein (DUF2147 family)
MSGHGLRTIKIRGISIVKFVTAAACGLFAFSCLASTGASASSAEGVWLSYDGGAKVRLTDCGGKLCGKIVWLDEPIDRATGRPKTDKHNPDPAKRVRPLIGLTVVYGMRPSGPNEWSGVIYNADDGRTYRAQLTVRSERVASLQGCMLGVLCQTRTWTRQGEESAIGHQASGLDR